MMKTTKPAFDARQHEAVVFDLDGVITRTETLHAHAWKRAFDEYLQAVDDPRSPKHRPFEIDPEYYRYVDGKPRYEGAASFLHARGLSLPHGTPDDPPGKATVCGIGNRKNVLFLELLETEGVQVYERSLRFVRELRAAGIPLAVISSSKNCVPVLAAAGALDLFDTKIDGQDAQARGLRGKPEPDIFLAAARELGVAPEASAAVEDSTAGVQAARKARYRCVVGVNRGSGRQAEALREHGAHIVVSELDALLSDDAPLAPQAAALPAAQLRALEQALGDADPALFLDYDGTLTPIVDRPEDAVLADATRAALSRAASRYVTAIISGRDLEDLKPRVGLDNIIYAGSHGFDIALPGGERESPAEAEAARPALERAADSIEQCLDSIEGVIVERKRFAITVHYRLADERRLDEIEDAVDAAVAAHPGLRKRGGKKIFELLPDIDWDKGEALLRLLDTLGLGAESGTVPIYVGDDLTDEDAFAALGTDGIAIAVGREPEDTSARLLLPDPDAVRQLLDWLCDRKAAGE